MKKIIILLGFLGILGGSAMSASAGYFNATPVSRCDTQITYTLQMGSENSDVYVLQNMLSHGGYLYVAPNGYFGPSTKAAVKRFQVANGISATGVVGEATRNAINERLCDMDVRGDSLSYTSFGSTSGITYVDQYDPYVKVISPQVTTPAVYATPQETVNSFSAILNSSQSYSTVVGQNYNSTTGHQTSFVDGIVPVKNQVQSTSIIYNPSIGYTYGLTQKTGSITILTPGINSVYNEGDTVAISWTSKDLNATGYQILLENTHTGQSRQVAVARTSNNASFVLTKELLDAVCSSVCDNYQQGLFRVVVSTPVTDIAGVTTNFRAAVSPVTIRRPYSVSAAVTLTTSNSPVNSGQVFKLYVNSASINLANSGINGDIVVKLHAICLNNIQVSIAGVPCGQDLTMPASVLVTQQGVPTMITNTTWYKQDVAFEVTLSTPAGQIIGTAKTTVTSNPAPFAW